MNIENEIFKKSIVNFDKLIKYGFKKEKDYLIYSKKIMNNDFEVIIKIDSHGKLNGKIIDLSINEEYISFRSTNNIGSFASSIREEYTKILNDIKDNCYTSNSFIFPQSNRVCKYILSKYKDMPEFLWDKYSGSGIFRNKNNKKWYAIIMNVDRSKITKGSGEIEVIDIKLDEDTINSLLTENNYYEAYHMNKKNWITIILNDSIDDTILFSLIDSSYSIVDNNKSLTNNWIVPANPKYYDVTKYNENDIIEWKQTSNVLIKDIVYIYLGSPYSSIIYKGEVIEKDIPFYYEDNNLKMTKVMKLKILKKYDKEYPLSKLKSLGLSSVRSARRLPSKLVKELNK